MRGPCQSWRCPCRSPRRAQLPGATPTTRGFVRLFTPGEADPAAQTADPLAALHFAPGWPPPPPPGARSSISLLSQLHPLMSATQRWHRARGKRRRRRRRQSPTRRCSAAARSACSPRRAEAPRRDLSKLRRRSPRTARSPTAPVIRAARSDISEGSEFVCGRPGFCVSKPSGGLRVVAWVDNFL